MENTKFGFEDLNVWKEVRKFKIEIATLAKTFPTEEKYRLTDQILRSSRSVNALISEGHGRFTYPDQLHYCIQARGSLSETINHLIDAFDEKFINEERLIYFKIAAKNIEKLLNGYITYLRTQRDKK